MYSIFGYVKNQAGQPIQNAKVYPYFKKVDSGSSESKWADNPYTTDANGYYTFDLEDAQLLDVTGSYKKGSDKVYLAIVYNADDINTQGLNDLTFTDCLFIEHVTVPAVDFYEMNLPIEPKRKPIITSSSLPDANLLTRHNYTMSETSYADYTWKSLAPYTENEISQKLLYDLVPIFDGHQLIKTLYDWGEIEPREVNNNSSDTYQFDIAGVYNVCITVREKWNTEETICKEVTVKYNQPTADFDWNPKLTNNWDGNKIKGQELITFTNESSDIDNRVKDVSKWADETYTYKWVITDELQDGSDNTQVYDNKDWYFEPTHAFQSAGTKTITLTIYWNDGFNDYTETVTKTLEVHAFDIVPDFVWNKIPKHRNDPVTLTSTTTGDTNQIFQLDWVIEDSYPAPDVDVYTFASDETSIFSEGSPDNTIVVDNTYDLTDVEQPTIKFHSIGAKEIVLTLHYYDGWKDVTKTITKSLTPVKYTTDPAFTISNNTPQGRFEKVVFNNTTSYIRDAYDIGYSIDWRLNDFYMACNLDNPEDINVDNYVEQIDVVKDTVLEHYYQNTSDNDIELTVRYDDGYQMITKRLTKTVTPIVFPAPTPEFSWDPVNPVGRHDLVTITNDTVYDNTRSRGIDWFLSDYYSACNLDNDTGEIKNNDVSFIRKTYDFTPTHYYQSPQAHDIKMVYYYDDGFCEKLVSKTKTITPVVFAPPTPDFTWDTTTPISREELVTFSNTTIDDDNRFRSYDWVIPDSYNIYNPDNPDYGVSVTDNTYTVNNELDKAFQPQHYFQDKISRDIKMTYHYDDGYCDRIVEKTKIISFTEYTITPIIDTDITPVANGFQGKIEVNYFNASTGDGVDRQISELWKFNDRTFPDNLDNITEFTNTIIGGDMPFTYQSPSRKPYTAIDNSTEQNINKNVWLRIRYDNGWVDTTTVQTERDFEASPNEVSSLITYDENILNYTH